MGAPRPPPPPSPGNGPAGDGGCPRPAATRAFPGTGGETQVRLVPGPGFPGGAQTFRGKIPLSLFCCCCFGGVGSGEAGRVFSGKQMLLAGFRGFFSVRGSLAAC